MDDPGKPQRWREGTLTAMGISLFVGFLTLLGQGTLNEAMTAVCITFWAGFSFIFFCHIRKSAATLEYQEQLRRDEARLHE